MTFYQPVLYMLQVIFAELDSNEMCILCVIHFMYNYYTELPNNTRKQKGLQKHNAHAEFFNRIY